MATGKKGFYPFRDILRVNRYGAKASETIAVGDLVSLDASTGYVDIAATGDTTILGAAASAVTSATAGDAIEVYDHPDQVYMAQHAGTPQQADVVDAMDMTGSTGAMQATSSSNADLTCVGLHPDDTPGSSSRVLVKITDHAFKN